MFSGCCAGQDAVTHGLRSRATSICHRAIRAGRYSIGDVAGELGEVISGRVAGRTSDGDITVAKLVGIGAQDLVAAEVTLAKL